LFWRKLVRQQRADAAERERSRGQGRPATILAVENQSGTRGQSLAEYALIVALIVIVALVALTLFGTQINDILSIVRNQINGGS